MIAVDGEGSVGLDVATAIAGGGVVVGGVAVVVDVAAVAGVVVAGGVGAVF